MIKRFSKFIFCGLLITILALTGCGSAQTGQIAARLAPDFVLQDLAGQAISLDSLRGRLVVINVWATTCASCVAEMPYFQELEKDWQGRGDVQLLLVNQGESASQVKYFMDSRNYSFKVLLDTNYYFGQQYNIRFTPTTIIIDRDGILRNTIIGPFKNKKAILDMLGPYLTGNSH
jgi:thiol-disulfide isomerase/thioredoxin